ncbi:hypothetical protein Ndes2526B_g05337 [Nannochloris sp. 'desiccata']|nr:hypothetical protein KSW81_006309 [Chlorella desiccata (nom. nud.)]KAG7674597.1 hypothetical protein KSW81_000246 [Chlorella desiccata (nom. nud.)]KAH7620084.1 putative Protein SENSITIVITY TO RED LIGHT REDUCED 1 [Chlorella desiccata (nom. nud.)]
MDGGWEVAKKGKRRKGGNANGLTRPSLNSAPNMSIEPTEKSTARHIEAVEDARRELLCSKFYSTFLATLSTARLPARIETTSTTDPSLLVSAIKNLVIYGLGSLDQLGGVHIRYQLALACQLSSLLSNLIARPEAFDPVFSLHDHLILPLCGIDIIKENENGRRIAKQPTLFFMPHCEADLTDSLLTTNVASETLQNVVIIGNSFSKYHERWSMLSTSQQEQQKRPETLLGFVENSKVFEISLPENGFPVTAAFNDMSLHMFI